MEQRKKALQERYSIAFPEDFFQFWEFACHLNPENPLEALIEPLDINLVGPFEFLGGRFDGKEPKLSFDLHWRYYRDPPEFFTVLQGHVDGLHWGYYFDDPNSLPSCVSHYYQNDAYALSQDGTTLFDAVQNALEMVHEDILQDIQYGLEDSDDARERISKLNQLSEELQQYSNKYDLTTTEQERIITAETWDEMGIVIPEELYRPLSGYLKSEKLNDAKEALNAGFPGTALKFGKDLWALNTEEWNHHAFELLDAAYAALDRKLLQQILRNHWKYRDPVLAYIDILDDWYL